LYPVSGDVVHYTQIGAFFACRELMKHINKYFPEIIPYELSDVDIHYDRIGTPDVSFKQEKAYKKRDQSFFNDIDYDYNLQSFYEAFENTESGLPAILFLRDSYAYEHYIGKYIAQHFGKTIMIHWYGIGHIEEYIAKYKPDVVVFESAEFGLREFANTVAKIPELP